MKSLILASLVLLAPSAAAQDGCQFEQAELDAIVAEAWPAVAAALGVEGEPPAVRLARSREVRDALRAELLPQLRVSYPKEAQAEAVARQKASQLTSSLYAKTVFGTGEILVLQGTFERLARLLELPDVCSRAALRGVLVHELVHVADDRRFGLAATAALADSDETLRMVDALFEGHAQHVARRVCAELGWGAGFDAFTASIDAYPPNKEGAGIDLVLRVRAAEASVSYVQGERFVRAVVEARGEDGVRALFTEPPTDLALLFRPDWFLDPSTRPPTRARLDAGLEELGKGLASTKWIPTRLQISLGQLAASFSALPPDRADDGRAILGAMLTNEGFFLSRPDGTSKSAILYEFPSDEEARTFVELNEVLMRQKDEDMREGAVRVLEAVYEPLEEPSFEGVLVHKRMQVGDVEQLVNLLVAARGEIVLELTYVIQPVEFVELVELGGRILDQVFTSAPPTRLMLDFEELEPGALPSGWSAAQTNAGASEATWSTVEIPSAPSGSRALRVGTEASGTTYNLLLSSEPQPADLELTVSLCADTGEEDQGGGLVWRAQGPDDYYVARWNPLERNLRVYHVKGTERTLLQSADTPVAAEVWHTLRVTQRGPHIQVALDGVNYLDVEDATFQEAGRIGLWTKADASTWFDDLVVR